MDNIIRAVFCGSRYATTKSAWLIDHGMVLKLSGVELPEVYEVDFSNSKTSAAKRVLGNADGVVIPDEYFLSKAQQIYAWVYLTTGDSGYTVLQVTIPLTQRPDVSTEPPTPQETDLIEQAIAALNDGVERAEAAADLLENASAEATTLEPGSEASASYADGVFAFGIPKGDRGEQGPKGDTGATGQKGDTGDTGPKGDKGDKLVYDDLTEADKDDLVQGPILEAQTSAVAAIGTAKTNAVNAVNQAGTTNKNAVTQEGTTQVNTVREAGTTQVGRVTNEGNTQVNRVQTKGDEVIGSIPQDYSDLVDDVADLSRQLSDVEDFVIEHPTAEYRKADVRSGSLQANGSYSAESDAFGVGYKIPLAPNGKITITPYGPEGFKYVIRFVTFADGETSGTLTQTGVLTDESYTFTQPTTKAYLMFCLYYKHTDGSNWDNIFNEFSDTDILVKTEIITEVLPLVRLDELESVQNQITEQAETLEFNHSYLNILQGASTFQDNKFISDRGIVTTNSNFCLIDGFFPVKPNTTYKLYRGEPSLYSNSGHNWTWWDSNKTFISYALSGSAVTSPSNAAFLRFAVYISSTGSVTHSDFDPSKVIITEGALPCFDDIFIKTSARPTFNGLKWIGIGDSITEDNFRATYHYWSYIAAETGLNFVNMGVSGTGYKAEGSGDKAFYKRVPSMATDADVITIFGGVNDVVLSSATIGTETDTGTETICGCVNATLDAIETLYPAHMPIGIISPLPCYCSDTTVNIHPYQQPNDDTCRMAQFVEQLALICKHRGIPFLDLFHQSNLRPWHQECNAKYFSCDSAKTGDGLHPNGHGHRLFYRQIMDFVQKIVMQ